LAANGQKINNALDAELHQLYEPRFTGFDDQTLVYPLRLNNRLAALQNYGQGDYMPTQQDLDVLAELSKELAQVMAKVKQTMEVDLPGFNAQLKAAGLPEVKVALVDTPGQN
jgi:hypothetical protein